MKKILSRLSFLLPALLAMWACAEKEVEYSVGGVAAVTELIAPAGTEPLWLDVDEEDVTFTWKTVSSGAVEYQVVFLAGVSGEELYRFVPADGAGRGTTAIPVSVLDGIASMAGIKTAAEGDLYWTVVTTLGPVETKASAAPKKLPVVRVEGIESPVHLYITGAATEGGTDISAAMPFRNDTPGVFTIYTRLKAGQPFLFTDSNFGTGYHAYAYSLGERIYIEDGEPMTVAADGIYRVTANIRYNRYSAELIENLRLFYPDGIDVGGTPAYEFPMEYQGGGLWKLEDFRLAFTDNHYVFRVDVAGKPRVWGHSEKGTGATPTSTEGTYYYVYENSATLDYDYCYRLMSGLVGVTTDVFVDMSATAAVTTHRFDLPRVSEAPPVTALTAPADGAAVDLNSTFTTTFSWAALAGQAFPPKYEVVLFADAAGETELAAIQAGDFGMEAQVAAGRSPLDDAARDAGIDIGQSGTIYWSVRTVMLNHSSMATPAPRRLDITRIALPSQLYISGAATEKASVADALKMRKLEDGVFQGYYTFTNDAGGYTLTDGTSGEYLTYVMSGGELRPGTGTLSTSAFGGIGAQGRQYRITVDFKTNTISTQIIRTVRFHLQGRSRNAAMNYQGNGVWKTSDNWNVGTGNDTRYYVRVSYTTANPSNDGSAWTEKWGCSRFNSDPNPTAGNLESSYGGKSYFDVATYIGRDNFHAPGRDNENDWDYAWKMVTEGSFTNTGGKTFTIYMNGGSGTGTTTGQITSDNPFHTY